MVKAGKFASLKASALRIVGCLVLFLLFYACFETWNVNSNCFHDYFLKIGNNATIAMHLRKLTAKPHIAGTHEDFEIAEYVSKMFKSYGLATHSRDYQVLLSYPVSRRVLLSVVNREQKLIGDEDFSMGSKPVPPFHAYSPPGEVTGEAIYVNYGRIEDLEELERMGYSMNGSIAIARQGMLFRGGMVKNCANAGALAVLIYPDPEQFGGELGETGYPHSKWLPKNGAQRGTVFGGVGDPLSPGWPSTPSSEKLSAQELALVLPLIPSLPISADVALQIMSSLAGPIAPPHWHGELQLPSYRIGPGPAILNISYEANQVMASIRNVFGVIKGWEEPDRYVLMGNHRDAWTFGAVDPNSGTAVLLEVARRFGEMIKQGWHPRRSILLCSWDAEEYGLVGSTEWVEENAMLLSSRAVAYINVDCAVAGPGFYAYSTPQLDQLLVAATKLVKDPDDSSTTVYHSWMALGKSSDLTIGRLGGGGSDYASFLHHVGVPSMDISFGKDYPVYHSLYDDFLWMVKFGDPEFQRHLAVGAIWGLVSLELADTEILPFNYAGYAQELEEYVKSLDLRLRSIASPVPVETAPLFRALKCLNEAIETVTKAQEALGRRSTGSHILFPMIGRRDLNDRLLLAERAFADVNGLPNKPWYKHLIYAPTTHGGYGSMPFPGVSDALTIAISSNSSKAWCAVQHEIWRVSRAITRASLVLSGELT